MCSVAYRSVSSGNVVAVIYIFVAHMVATGKKLQNEKITACAKFKLSISRAFTGCLEQLVASERNTADDDEPKGD